MLKTYRKWLLFIFVISYASVIFSVTAQQMDEQFLEHLPSGSKKIAQHRFQSSTSYKLTKSRFYYRFLGSKSVKVIGEEINLPHVRTISYKNYDKDAQFSAINIYLNMQTGVTEVFFVVDDKKFGEENN